MLRLTIRPVESGCFPAQGLTEVNAWRDQAGTVCARSYVRGDERWMRFPGLAAFRFDQIGNIEAFPERQIDSDAIVDLYRRTVEPLAFQALGWEALHGSAVCTPSGLVGFCGERESGKSTIAFALSGRPGYRQFADDAIVVEVDGTEVRALPLPFHARLRPEAEAFFRSTPSTLRYVGPTFRSGNATLSTPSTLSTPTSLDVLFVLRRVPLGKPVAERLSPSAAFAAALAHAHAFDPGNAESRRRTLAHYLDIASAVPVYALRFAAGLHELDTVLCCIERAIEATQGLKSI